MQWTKTESGDLVAGGRILLGALGNGADQVLQQLKNDPAYATNLAQFALNGARERSMQLRIAQAIPGTVVFTAEDWMKLYGARFTNTELKRALQFPLHEDILNGPCPFNKGKRLLETHTAFFGVEKLDGKPLTIMQWHALHLEQKEGQPFFDFSDRANPWCANEKFASKVTLKACWYVGLTEHVPGSTGKSPEEQVKLLPPEYEIPTASAEVTKDFAYLLKTGKWPNQGVWARCAETTSGGRFLVVGVSGGDGLDVRHWVGLPEDCAGCGAFRKLRASSS